MEFLMLTVGSRSEQHAVGLVCEQVFSSCCASIGRMLVVTLRFFGVELYL
jgi:hypothetical protein